MSGNEGTLGVGIVEGCKGEAAHITRHTTIDSASLEFLSAAAGVLLVRSATSAGLGRRAGFLLPPRIQGAGWSGPPQLRHETGVSYCGLLSFDVPDVRPIF